MKYIFYISFVFFVQHVVVAATPMYRPEAKTIQSQAFYTKVASLYELIVSDIDAAEKEILLLKKENKGLEYKDSWIDILLLEAEFYRAKGDFSHMKLALYQALSSKNKLTSKFNTLLLEYYKALNQSVGKRYLPFENKLKSIIRKARKRGFRYIEAKAHQSLGKYYSSKKKYNLSDENFVKAQAILKKINFQTLAFDIEIARGVNFYWKGNFSRALETFHQTKEIALKKKYQKCYLNTLLNLGEAHLFIEGNEDSAKYYLKLVEDQKDVADIRDVYQCYWALSQYYKKKGLLNMRTYYTDLMYKTENKIRSKMIEKLNIDIDYVYRKLQNERYLDEENHREKTLKLIFALIGIFFLIITIIFWFIIGEKTKLNETLTQQRDEIGIKKKQLDQALREKEILLKEIHHRVKNNLQIISSLLSLQSKNITDEAAREAIFEGKERIQAIALIHQKLYQNDTYATIEMKNYLEDLIEQLSQSYDQETRNVSIKLNTNDIVLNLDTVVPLGLIICELITNAFKYAFKNKNDAKLRLDIVQLEEDYQLSVKDNGHGMNETFDFLNSPTLGVEIVRALTEQLDGTISYKSSENGTTIKIRFKKIINS